MDPQFFKTDDGNHVAFEWGTTKNEAATTREGRPIFDKVLRARIVSPGNAKQEMFYEVERHFSNGTTRINKAVSARFAAQLGAWRSQESNPDLTGTPLTAWPALDVAQIATMHALRIYTVEALADLSDAGLQALGMGARGLQAKAKAFLEAAKGNAPTERLAAENEQLRGRVAELEQRIEALAAAVGDDEAPKPKRGKAA